MSDIKTQHLTIEGRCLCGDVRYQVDGERSGIIHCHCQRCRKHTGSAFISFTVFESGIFRWLDGQDMLGVAQDIPGDRTFCQRCGSSMPPASCQDKKMEDLFSGNCLSMPPVELIYHFYTDSKCSWYEIPDNAHQWDTVPSRFRDPKLDNLQRNTEVGRLTGSCLCGEVAFAATSPVMMMNCHCSRCRLSRSSAHATNVFVPVEKFQWRKGERCIENYRLPGADRFGTAFCKLCGSLLPRIAGPHDDKINIPAGTLDSDPGMKPRGHIYTDSKAPWFTIEDALPQWPRLP